MPERYQVVRVPEGNLLGSYITLQEARARVEILLILFPKKYILRDLMILVRDTMLEKDRPREETLALEQEIPIMRMQYKAIMDLATIEQLRALLPHINLEMIDDMEKLASPEDISLQFFRICKEIRDIGLADAVNEHVQNQYVDLKRASISRPTAD